MVKLPVNPLQPLKAPVCIVIKELGKVSPVKPLQPEKALAPIEVTEFGIVRLPVNPVQPEKAVLLMDDTI